MDTSSDDSVLIITSDHGENLGDHGLMDHQFSVHESLLAHGERSEPVWLHVMETDDRQLIDLSADHPELVRQLEEETRKQLESLGYLR